MKWWDRGWNPVQGCQKCSDGCKNCYAECLVQKRSKAEKNISFDIHINEKQIKKKFDDTNEFVFVCSQSDLFHHSISEDVLDEIFDKMVDCKSKKFAVCTKRSAYMREYFNNFNLPEKDYSNVIFGVTVESNKYKSRIDDLLNTDRIKYRFLSLEPMLEEMDIESYLKTKLIDWVIVGCESGENHRKCENKWIENVVKQCKTYDIPVFVNNITSNTSNEITDVLEGSNVNYREFFDDFKIH